MQQAEKADSTRAGDASPGKTDEISARRRSILMGAALTMTAAGAGPVLARSSDAVTRFEALSSRYIAAAADLNALKHRDHSEEEYDVLAARFHAASNELDDTPPPTWRHFLFKLENAWEDDGDPTEMLKAKLLRDARGLIARGVA